MGHLQDTTEAEGDMGVIHLPPWQAWLADHIEQHDRGRLRLGVCLVIHLHLFLGSCHHHREPAHPAITLFLALLAHSKVTSDKTK